MQTLSVTIQMGATEQYFPVVLFITLCKEVVAFEFLNANLKCDHSSGSYWAVLSYNTYIAVPDPDLGIREGGGVGGGQP